MSYVNTILRSWNHRLIKGSRMDLARTAAYWDAFARTTPQHNPAEWLDHPLMRARLELLRGGRSVEQWLSLIHI